jgi:glyoxylase-like metal-dependent hydrolase (beta-lactamase superfamily II)
MMANAIAMVKLCPMSARVIYRTCATLMIDATPLWPRDAMNPTSPGATKPPRFILDTILAFPPNRETLGGTAYLILDRGQTGQACNILVDAPPWESTIQDFLIDYGGVRWWFISHRGNLGRAAAIHQALGCEVVIQEQEAYLLPDIPTTTFQQNFRFTPQTEAFWTPGHSPGSACLYHQGYGGVLFSGRHLLPDGDLNPMPMRFAKTFHWPRQLRSVDRLRQRFSPETLAHICPGANTGFLRGQPTIDRAYGRLQSFDLEALRQSAAPL